MSSIDYMPITNLNRSKNLESPIIEKEIKQPFICIDYWNDSLENFDKETKKKKLIVERVLSLNPQATNSDVVLFFECLRYEFPEIKFKDNQDNIMLKIPKSVFKRISSPETFRRVRQKLNAKGKYLPTNPLVLERRKNKEVTMRKYFGMIKEKENGN